MVRNFVHATGAASDLQECYVAGQNGSDPTSSRQRPIESVLPTELALQPGEVLDGLWPLADGSWAAVEDSL
ncbi:MAG TPA: hypothetical protein VGS08_00995 [Candidatus Saccharimonadales bacterium]|nr:hypothetical protein [Candidatus Saccharimonadales bacterium]